jgi:four helix bundle protein
MEEEFGKYLSLNKNINRGYRSLDVWKEAIELFAFVKNKIKELNTISFKVRGQIEDSVFSVSSNIAEGYCRRSLKENIQFNSIALASLGENYSQISALLNSRDITADWFELFDKKHYALENKLISLNRSFIQKSKKDDDWKSDYIIREFVESYGLDE